MKRKVVKRKKKVKRSRYIFSVVNSNVAYSENESNRPLIYSEQKTFRVSSRGSKFIVYELNRKEKPKKVKTINRSKSVRSKTDVERLFVSDRVNYKKTYNVRQGDNGLVIQGNKKPQRKRFQLVAIVDVYDEKRDIGNHYTCWSRKVFTSEISIARADLITMARAKFFNDYGVRKNSNESLQTTIREETIRYQYTKYF